MNVGNDCSMLTSRARGTLYLTNCECRPVWWIHFLASDSLVYVVISVNIVLGTIVVSSVSIEDFAL